MLSKRTWSFWPLLLYFAPWAAGAAGAVQQTGQLGYGTVEFLVLDSYGKPLRSSEIEVFREGSNSPGRRMKGKAIVVTLPYDTYVVRASAFLHHTFERRFLLKEPRLFVTVALSFRDPGESPYVFGPPFQLRISPRPGVEGRLWVRLVSMLGVYVKEAVVGPSGEVGISEVPLGDYVVLVFHDLLLIKSVQFRRTLRNEACSIRLSEKEE